MRFAWIVLAAGCGFQSQATPATGGGAGSSEPDAGPVFDNTICPATYNVPLPGPTRYRLITAGNSAWGQSDACNADRSGVTHLVVLETITELMSVSAYVDNVFPAPAGNAVWVGGVQQRTATTPRENWLGFDGAALINMWDPNEPNDGSTETDHSEQFAFLENARRLADRPGDNGLGALCECDGKPVAQNAADAITSNRP